MTNEEMFKFLGFDRDGVDPAKAKAYISVLTPEDRELFERMRAIELWDNGFGPKPTFPVILCHERRK